VTRCPLGARPDHEAPKPRVAGARAGHDESLLEYEISLVPDPAHDYGFGEFIAAGRL